ncbi:transposase [Streptomyces sp. NPDC006476]|uniref:transposase n=1 Tax=Streptomyces sp. NPDC006476 TaxID=3157175 RepID=UPI0033B8FBA6
MTDTEWVIVRDAMPVPPWLQGRGGQPEGYCHRQMSDAVRSLVDNGIKWWAMPADFPAWDRVYAFARRWRARGLLAEFHDRLRGMVREDAGRDPEPTAAVIDAQSLRAAATVPASSRGCLGLLLAVLVTAAPGGEREPDRGRIDDPAPIRQPLHLRAHALHTGRDRRQPQCGDDLLTRHHPVPV